MPLQFREEITPREIVSHEWEVEMFDKQAEHAVRIKELDIQAAKLEARISSWFRIPLYIFSLPVKLLAIIPLCIYAVRRTEVPQELWNLLK